MKGTIASLAGTLVVGAALALPAVSFARRRATRPAARGEFPGVTRRVISSTKRKRFLCTEAAGDFHSHKASAIARIDQEIQEINSGIKEEGGTP